MHLTITNCFPPSMIVYWSLRLSSALPALSLFFRTAEKTLGWNVTAKTETGSNEKLCPNVHCWNQIQNLGSHFVFHLNLTFPFFSVHHSLFYLVHHLRPLWSWILLPMSEGAKDRSWYRIVAVVGCWERSSLHLRRLEHAVYAAQSRQWADCSSEAFKGVECEGVNFRK